ncbi:hypothetical protein Tco_0730006 [Tanacetum coccineum]|uniref:Uncharacterized protein n=1 Tax=Tanacetum coccineum TaxID=301880 RepID=A0ABQ4YT05_9ASTR
MSSKAKPLFDLNEPAAEEEEDEENDGVLCFQPQRAIPSTTHTSDLFKATNSPRRIINNNAFSHASSVSGFRPFVRAKGIQTAETEDRKKEIDIGSAFEKEEGEWSDAEDSNMPVKLSNDLDDKSKVKSMAVLTGHGNSSTAAAVDTNSNVVIVKNENSNQGLLGVDVVKDENSNHGSFGVDDVKDENSNNGSLGLNVVKDENSNHGSSGLNVVKNENSNHGSSGLNVVKDENSNHGSLGLDGDSNDRKSSDSQEDRVVAPKQKDIKGAEAVHALKLANNAGKRPRIDHQKEAMLGKKRSRQTMFLNLEDVKQAGAIKTSTPKRQIPPITTRVTKDKQIQPPMTKDTKQVDQSCNESSSNVESSDLKSDCNNGDMNSGLSGRPKRSISSIDLAAEDKPLPSQRQSILKQTKNAQVSSRKTVLISQNSIDPKTGGKKLPSKKPATVTNQYQDTSVERLLREVTNDKFWQHPVTLVSLSFQSGRGLGL